MGREEQVEEREVLESIFPDEITDISETSYRVSITLEATKWDEENGIDPPTILLAVSLPPSYPDEAPTLDISAPPNFTKHPHFDISTDRSSLLSSLSPIIEENISSPMIFTLLSSLKESAELLILDRQQLIQKEKESKAREAEEEENKKFHGEAVTRESFLNWRDGFVREMEEIEEKRREEKEMEDRKRRGGKSEEEKLTGRMLWERGLVGVVEDDVGVDEDEVEGMGEGVESLKV